MEREWASGRLVDGRVKPFASIDPEMLSQLSVLERPTAVLTKNYASFNRQVREIEDGNLAVYTGGFPAGPHGPGGPVEKAGYRNARSLPRSGALSRKRVQTRIRNLGSDPIRT